MPRHPLALALVAAASLGACAGTGPAANEWADQLRADGWKPGATVPSIPDFRIDGFKALDASHLVIYGGVDRRHLITFGSPCSGLLFAQRLGYSVPSGSLGRLDRLMVFGHQGIHVECVIDSIQSLEKVTG